MHRVFTRSVQGFCFSKGCTNIQGYKQEGFFRVVQGLYVSDRAFIGVVIGFRPW